jgi:hypothetical protein
VGLDCDFHECPLTGNRDSRPRVRDETLIECRGEEVVSLEVFIHKSLYRRLHLE